jgi:hypothetical protein
MHVALRHDFAHEPSKRTAGTELNHFRDAGGLAGLHAGSPVDGLLDLARKLICARAHVEHGISIDPTQQTNMGWQLRR